jgi:hypothetical protein
LSGNPKLVQLESNFTTQIYTQKFQNANFFQTFFLRCIALQFVKERAAYFCIFGGLINPKLVQLDTRPAHDARGGVDVYFSRRKKNLTRRLNRSY